MMRGRFVNDEDEIEFIVKREDEETEKSRAPRPLRNQMYSYFAELKSSVNEKKKGFKLKERSIGRKLNEDFD